MLIYGARVFLIVVVCTILVNITIMWGPPFYVTVLVCYGGSTYDPVYHVNTHGAYPTTLKGGCMRGEKGGEGVEKVILG